MSRSLMVFTAALCLLASPFSLATTKVEPVTDAMLANPDPADWLMWRRTLNSWGYSPLKQINRDTVAGLRMVWVKPLADGSQEGTPLVHNGILYFPEPGDVISAVDAASGRVIWQSRRHLPGDIAQHLTVHDTNRNLAIYGKLIIDTSADDYLYALDAETGKLVWETKILDYKAGAKQSSGPIIAKGLAISGRSCEAKGGIDACVITAHDARTGREVWRTGTIARGDDPNSASWGDVPESERKHVGAWMIPSYDPELNLIYMGTSVTAPAPKILLDGSDKTYLYHNSTLALDADTGRIVWHYQHLVDHWDIDHPFERMLVDTQVAPDAAEVAWINPKIVPGKTYKVLTGVPGKTGIIYTLNRETGEFLWARPTVFQNLVQSIDGASGKVTTNPATVFTETGKPTMICPSSSGGKNYYAGAYSPQLDTMFLPAQNTCGTVSAVESAGGEFGLYSLATRNYIRAGTTNLGTLYAVSAKTGKTLWKREQRAGVQSLMTTAGGLVFMGDSDGRFRALNDSNGEVLWEMNIGSSVTGYPATFEVDGHQYVAVSTGRWFDDVFTPELIHGTQNTLFVFALPQAGIGQAGPAKAPLAVPGGTAVHAALHRTPGQRDAHQSYNAGQAARGAALFAQHCAECHGAKMAGAASAPPLLGPAFMANWQGRTLSELFMFIKIAMPPGKAGILADPQYAELIAHILQSNGIQAGKPQLSADPDALESIRIE